MNEPRKTYRDVEQTTKETLRDWDGHDATDDLGNAGDEVRKDLGNAGDEVRKDLGNAGDEVRRQAATAGHDVDRRLEPDRWDDPVERDPTAPAMRR